MKKAFTKEVKIGIAFIVTLVLLYVGINFLKGVNIFKPSNSYVIVFDDVTGLALSSPVLMNGYQVGLVHSMNLDQSDANKVAVTINLDKQIKIAKGSKIKLDVSIMGSATISIDQDPLAKDYYSPDDRIPGMRNPGALESIGQTVGPTVEMLVPKIDSILTAVNGLLNNPALAQSLENMSVITTDLTVATKQMNQMMVTLNKDLPVLSGNMKTITGDLAVTTGKLKTMDIESTYKSVDATMKNMESLTQRLNSKEGSLGLLLNDRGLYDSLNFTIGTAGLLMKDLKENPSKYINIKVF